MSLLVRPCHHHRFRAVLHDSFRLRREVFSGRPDAAPSEAGSGLEHDDLDGGAAFYLVNFDAAGRAIATVRIIPGAASAQTCDRLARRMGAPMPRGSQVVELSRLCADPRLARTDRLRTLLELRAGIGLLFLRHGWTHGATVGHDRHIQPLIQSGMTVQVLAPPLLLPGDSELSFAVLATDPDRPWQAAGRPGGWPFRLQDPDEDPALFTRYGDRAVA